MQTELLIIGAGPYGLATAAYAMRRGLDCRIVGEPMGFWKHHMPEGMLLRSGADWHLDPQGIFTFEAFLKTRSIDPATVLPIPLALFLAYAAWFQERAGLSVDPALVTALWRDEGGYEAELTDGRRLAATNVVVATGIRHFPHLPPELVRDLPPSSYAHTCDLIDLAPLKDRRCLIVGGRQSAFEWAALIHEQGATAIDIVYRHDTPRFEESHWSWVDPLLDETIRVPGWFRSLTPAEREVIAQRFWAEGRLKLEPWLWPRLDQPQITCRPHRQVLAYRETGNGEVEVTFDDGTVLPVDRVVLATGYRVDLRRLPFLTATTIIDQLSLVDGYPVLDEHFQSSLPGLFFPGLAATRDFGPFFGFVRGCPVAGRLIVDRIAGN